MSSFQNTYIFIYVISDFMQMVNDTHTHTKIKIKLKNENEDNSNEFCQNTNEQH